MKATIMSDVRFYLGRRDTRWDPYPSQEPLALVAHDWWGFWEPDGKGGWFKTPTSFHLGRELTRAEAESHELFKKFRCA